MLYIVNGEFKGRVFCQILPQFQRISLSATWHCQLWKRSIYDILIKSPFWQHYKNKHTKTKQLKIRLNRNEDNNNLILRNMFFGCMFQHTSLADISSDVSIGTIAVVRIHQINTDAIVLTWVRITFINICQLNICEMEIAIRLLYDIESILMTFNILSRDNFCFWEGSAFWAAILFIISISVLHFSSYCICLVCTDCVTFFINQKLALSNTISLYLPFLVN